jgi:hypothetical protein
MKIRHKTTAKDTVAGTWIDYDVQANIDARGWVKIGEVGQHTHAGWQGAYYDGTPFGQRWDACDTRRDATFEVVTAFERAVAKGEVNPATFVYRGLQPAPSAPTPSQALFSLGTRRVEVEQRYVLVSDAGMGPFAQVVESADDLETLEALAQRWGPFTIEETCAFPVGWSTGRVVRRYANPHLVPRPSREFFEQIQQDQPAALAALEAFTNLQDGKPSGISFEIVDLFQVPA